MPSNIIRKTRRPSIRDVAKAADVSTSTVSLVLNRQETVTPATRQRVEQAMQELGYRPRAAGRPIVRGFGRTILLIYSPSAIRGSELAPLAQAWTEGVCLTLASHGARLCSMVVQTDGPGHQPLETIVNTPGMIDGAIIVGNVDQTGVLESILTHRIPLVVINGRPEFGEYSHVSIDNYGSMLTALDYIVSLGHRRIAWLGAPGNYPFVLERNKGISDACARHGITPVFEAALDPIAHPEHIDPLCRQVLQSGATVLFTGDYAAVPMIRRWHEMGVEVPRDISVLGYDDLGFRTHDDRRITSIGFDKFHMGELTADAMLEILQDSQMLRGRSARMATRIVPGDTTRSIQLDPQQERQSP